MLATIAVERGHRASRARTGSRNSSAHVHRLAMPSTLPPCTASAAHREHVALGRQARRCSPRQQLFVHRERGLHVFGRNAADGEADVVEHVVATADRLVDQFEPDAAAHAPEVDEAVRSSTSMTRPGTPRHMLTPQLSAISSRLRLTIASATTAWPSAMPPSPGGTPRCRCTSNSGRAPRTMPSASRAFWKHPPLAHHRQPADASCDAARTSAAVAAASVLWKRGRDRRHRNAPATDVVDRRADRRAEIDLRRRTAVGDVERVASAPPSGRRPGSTSSAICPS